MRSTTSYSSCGICGASIGIVTNDIEDDNDDIHLPPGWVQIIVRRVAPNPDYKSPETAEQFVDRLITGLPPGAAEEEIQQMRGVGQMFASMRPEEDPEPMFQVEEAELHLCHEHALTLAGLDPEGFAESGWEKFAEAGEAAVAAQLAAYQAAQVPPVTIPAPVPQAEVSNDAEITDSGSATSPAATPAPETKPDGANGAKGVEKATNKNKPKPKKPETTESAA